VTQASYQVVASIGFALAVTVAMSEGAYGQESPTSPDVAAMVGDLPVFVSEVRRTLQGSLQGTKINKSRAAVLQARTLARLIQQRLITLRLAEIGQGATQTEIDTAIAQLKEQLAAKKKTIDEFLKERGTTIEAVRADVAFQIGTSHYLGVELNDEALEAFFNENRPRYDGSRLNVAHILLQIDGPNKAAATKLVLREAEALRERIVSGKITFEQAAREYSVGPSRHENGQLGLIPRQGVMVERFSDAAFHLKQGEISPPVLTKFGVHLIRWTDMKAGDKSWTDVRGQLQKALGNKLLNDLATIQRGTTKVTFTGVIPYVVPGTGRIVIPPASR